MAREILEGSVSSAFAAAVSVPLLAKTMKERQACRSSVFAIKASLLYCTQHFLLHEGTPKPNRFAAAASFHDVSA